MPRQVTAFSNATVKRLRSLRDKKARRAEGLFLAEGLRIIAEARDSGLLPEIVAFSPEGGAPPAGGRDHRRGRSRGRRCDRDRSPTSSPRCRARTIRRLLIGAYRQPETGARPPRPLGVRLVDRRPGAARSGQYRHHPAHRRRGRRGRADPHRRLRRPLFGRGGARVDGRDLHPADRGRAVGRVPAVAARRRRPAGRDQPQGRPTTISTRDYDQPCFLLIGNESRACPPLMRPSATCWSKSRWPGAPTASTRRSPRRSWPSRCARAGAAS